MSFSDDHPELVKQLAEFLRTVMNNENTLEVKVEDGVGANDIMGKLPEPPKEEPPPKTED